MRMSGLVSACVSTLLISAEAFSADPLALTDKGFVQGYQDVGYQGRIVAVFKGIPYAKPPVGELRWAAPQPADAWGVRLAKSFGPNCAQVGLQDANLVGDEDCLTINVWTTAPSAGAGYPVFVFLHGGANLVGSGDMELTRLASLSPTVIVTLNYRLGPFGFLSHPALAQGDPNHASGNYGIQDQIAALKWVQRNIVWFGGDPGKVTVGGYSAGAHDTSVLMVSPLAAGLFSRAIIQSHSWTVQSPAVVANTAGVTQKWLGCDGALDVAACMRSKSTLQVATTPGNGSSNLAWDPSCLQTNQGNGCRFNLATVDGYVLPDTPQKIAGAGAHNKMPAIVTSTLHEWTTIANLNDLQSKILTDDDLRFVLRAEFAQPIADAIFNLYPAAAYGNSPYWAYIFAQGDIRHHCPARNVLNVLSRVQPQPVWQALWTHVTASANPQLGANHGSDAPYFLQTYAPNSLTADEQVLSLYMSGTWLQFVRSGDPRSTSIPWPVYTPGSPLFWVWNIPMNLGSGWRHPNCDALEALGFTWEYFD